MQATGAVRVPEVDLVPCGGVAFDAWPPRRPRPGPPYFDFAASGDAGGAPLAWLDRSTSSNVTL